MHGQLRQPYLLLLGDVQNPVNAKTAFGLRDWARELCVGQLRFDGCKVDLGLPELTPRRAAALGCGTLIIGIAPQGGRLPPQWEQTLLDALEAGLDIAAGLHQRLSDIPELATRAAQLGRTLHDVRHTRAQFSLATGTPRPGRRLLTVGTDCALGKKYAALAIHRAMKSRGHDADFRATGQTGILISGRGVAIDAVIADFVAGAAEALSPANNPKHWDIIEGQGSLFHPAYAGVTLGLVHGSQPDALVLCHHPTRKTLNEYPHVPIKSPKAAMPLYLEAARLTNPNATFVGVAFNTSALPDEDARELLRQSAFELDMPCADPLRYGVDDIVSRLEHYFPS